MKTIIRLFFTASAAIVLLGIQSCNRGCMDKNAKNYDRDAKTDNGTCEYRPDEAKQLPVAPVMALKEKWYDLAVCEMVAKLYNICQADSTSYQCGIARKECPANTCTCELSAASGIFNIQDYFESYPSFAGEKCNKTYNQIASDYGMGYPDEASTQRQIDAGNPIVLGVFPTSLFYSSRGVLVIGYEWVKGVFWVTINDPKVYSGSAPYLDGEGAEQKQAGQFRIRYKDLIAIGKVADCLDQIHN
jgi:hypothetical protein